MKLIFFTSLTFGGAFLLLSLLVFLIWRRIRKPQPGGWKRFLYFQALLIPLLIIIGAPATLAWFGVYKVQTRRGELAYPGPRFDTEGRLRVMSRALLKTVAPPESAELETITARMHRVPGRDGLQLRMHHVPAHRRVPRAQVLLVHGLFRSAMELEPVAAMFRRTGCACWMLEMANHGASGRRAFTFGAKEQHDVRAAAAYIREQAPDIPLLAYGISLGGAMTSLAAPQIEGTRGLVIDAPMLTLRGAARRYLGSAERGPGLPGLAVDMICGWIQWFGGFDMNEVAPGAALRRMDPAVHCLILGAGQDHAMPADEVRQIFASLPQAADHKQLWIAPDSQHGKSFLDHPADYEIQIRDFVNRVLPPR